MRTPRHQRETCAFSIVRTGHVKAFPDYLAHACEKPGQEAHFPRCRSEKAQLPACHAESVIYC
jgi:hypothetical protein